MTKNITERNDKNSKWNVVRVGLMEGRNHGQITDGDLIFALKPRSEGPLGRNRCLQMRASYGY